MSRLLRKKFLEFSDSSKPIIVLMDDVDANAGGALKSVEIRKKHEAIQSSSIVLLSGYLESFLKDSAECFFFVVRDKGIAYSALPDVMKEKHIIHGFNELAKIAAKDKKNGDATFAAAIGAARAILQPISSGTSSLYWRAFAATKGNPGPEVIKEYLKGFDIKNPMGEVAQGISLSEGYINSTLQSFIELRNECAHTGSIKAVPTTVAIRDYIQFLRKLTLGISKVLEKRVASL
ncbi:HEPN domain-containing protein [Burkholderia gladioli]|uniref:HEPN domain-containing protein n=1 Tax=Burkholderia gladioli TaxID=28095 RepID=UPI00163E2913|nr:HEPN domain-containing protein [Burkholderia gladioli]